jgi:hypothetical protein
MPCIMAISAIEYELIKTKNIFFFSFVFRLSRDVFSSYNYPLYILFFLFDCRSRAGVFYKDELTDV